MRFKIALDLGTILSLSSIRSRRSRGGTPKGLVKRPSTNIYASIVAFPLATVMAYALGPLILGSLVEAMSSQLLIFLPSLAAFLSLMYSLMFEFNQSTKAATTDLLNWLPVSPAEYVV